MRNLEELTKECNEISELIKQNGEARDSHYVIDGIIDPEKYLKAKYRILWILKEANSENDTWSYIDNFKRKDWLLDYGKSNPTLRKIIYTTYGILSDLTWEGLPDASSEKSFEPLQEIALINIKKMPGTSVAITDTIQAAYDEDSEILKRQINLLDADIVIFGNTLNYFNKTDFKGLNNSEQQISEFGNHYYNTGDKLYINTWHPATRNMKDEDYVMDIVNIARNWQKTTQKTM
jgi:hypothetical protein